MKQTLFHRVFQPETNGNGSSLVLHLVLHPISRFTTFDPLQKAFSKTINNKNQKVM